MLEEKGTRLDTLSPEVFPRLNQRLVWEWHVVHKQPNEVGHVLSVVGEMKLILNIVRATSQKSIAGRLTGWFEWFKERTLVISFYLYHQFSHNNIPNRKRIKFGLRVSSAFSLHNNQWKYFVPSPFPPLYFFYYLRLEPFVLNQIKN